MPATVNERLQDAAVSHAVDLLHYSNGVVQRIVATLNRVDADLAAALMSALDRLPESEFNVQRLEGLLFSVRALNAQAYAQVGRELSDELRRFVEVEADHQLQLFQAIIPPQVQASVGVAAVNAEQVYAAAMARPFQGRLLAEWAQSLEADRLARIRDAVRIGFVEQQTISEIVRRVRGTRAKGYSDGIIEIDRRNAEAVVRTAVSHTAGTVRDRFFSDNSDLVKAIAWTATLDTRTSEICRLRDGKRYTCQEHKPIGHKLPWLSGPGRAHWNCRSTGVPITKSWAELGIDLPETPASTRASMDGQVPEDQTYGQWLRKQSAARQDEVLGATRGALFRRGGLALEAFANDKGRWLSLDELRARSGDAFRLAGV